MIKFESIEEWVRYGELPKDLCDLLENHLKERDDIKKESSYIYKSVELLEEQLYFARELLDTLESGLESAKSGKQARDIFRQTVEDSYFEW